MKLYIGNLTYGTTEDDLLEIFSEYGTVVSCTIIKDKIEGRSKGFGFIEFESSEAGQAAISALDGSEVGGRSIKVNEARPKR
jgi:RNA recognition motif-containing protein